MIKMDLAMSESLKDQSFFNEYLDILGVQLWTRRNGMPDDEVNSPQVEDIAIGTISDSRHEVVRTAVNTNFTNDLPADDSAKSEQLSSLDFESLKSLVSSCSKCALCQSRKNVVFGDGNINADLMIVGEAPGADEDIQGIPFVGRAGKLLENMLLAINLNRQIVFIGNILKCRPPNNRDPNPDEVAKCIPYLQRQIELIKPKVILALGRVAAQNLLGSTTPISKMRGEIYSFGEDSIPVIVTYHPAYLLRSPKEKSKAWGDLKKVFGILN